MKATTKNLSAIISKIENLQSPQMLREYQVTNAISQAIANLKLAKKIVEEHEKEVRLKREYKNILPPDEIFQLIKAEADKLGWPKRWESDLDIDHLSIAEQIKVSDHGIIKFAWGIWQEGTRMYDNKYRVLDASKEFSDIVWFYFDGYALHQMSVDELVELMN